MGDRYEINIVCPKCSTIDKDVYYAPTSGFIKHKCTSCKHEIDLEKYTGINAKSTSNAAEIHKLIHDLGGENA